MSADTDGKVIFKKVKEDANGKVWRVDAIHVTTTRNNRIYTREELVKAARGLSLRPINVNHNEDRYLYYNFANPTTPGSNSTIIMDFNPENNAVSGSLWISNGQQQLYKSVNSQLVPTGEFIDINSQIEAGNIQTVSIEQTPYKGESCSCASHACTCEQHGIVFSGIAILETFKGVQPGDPNAVIKPATTESAEPAKVADIPKEGEDAYPWDKCIADQKAKGYDDETAKKICGSIKAANELKNGCGCEKRKALIDELAKLERFLITGKLD